MSDFWTGFGLAFLVVGFVLLLRLIRLIVRFRHERRTGRMWQIRVTVPYGVVTADALNALFTAVADAAYDWEPADRDGWDVDVEAGPAR